MNLTAILNDLRQEHERIGVAIRSLEQLAATARPRRGRPPEWLRLARAGNHQPATRLGKKRAS